SIYAMVAMTAIVAFSSLGVDWGRVQLTKTELRCAADAAARYGLAGVGSGVTNAQDRAIAAASDNKADGSPVVLDRNLDIEFGSWNTATRTFTVLAGTDRNAANALRVTARRVSARGNAVGLSWGRLIGQSNCDVSASSIAFATPLGFAVIGIDYVHMS